MPTGERLKDPVTGEVFIVVESWSGRRLEAWLRERNKGGNYPLISAERMHRPEELTEEPAGLSPQGKP